MAVTASLTDGTGISRLLASKILKDLVLDFCLTIVPAFAAINVLNLNAALAVPGAIAIAAGDSAIRVAFRAIVRWAQSPS